jgi:hypothetical protein
MLTGLRDPHAIKDSNVIRRELYQNYALLSKYRLQAINYEHCSFWGSEDSVIPKAFILSVIAVENYARPPFRRWLEEVVARANLQFLGEVPDYSFGVGQIKLSTARLVIQQGTTTKTVVVNNNRELLKLVLDPCENMRLASEYLNMLMKKSGFSHFTKKSAFAILRQYNGQQDLDQKNQIYQEVVWEVFLLYENSL